MKIHAPALALGLSLLCNIVPSGLAIAGQALAADAPTATTVTIDPKADALMHKVSDFYAGLKTYHTTLVREGLKDGQHHTMKYKIEAEKPAKLSIEITGASQEFHGGLAKMDGEKLHLYNPTLGYVSSKAPGNYEDLIRDREFQFAMAHVLHGQNLLDALLTENPYSFMMIHYGITSGADLGEESIDGQKVEHLVFKSPRLAYDVWVERGSKPWVRRVSAERGNHMGEGKPVIFNYEKSSDSSQASASDFTFTPPAGAKEVQTFFTAQKDEQKKPEQAQPQASASGEPTHPLLNKPAPQLALDTIGGGKLDLESFKSKNVVVLDFWATWCPPCRMALPILAEVTKSYEDKGVKFFAVDLKEDQAKISAFLEKTGLKVNVALDTDGQAAGKYGVEGIPQSVIIGKDGVVRVVHRGFSSDLKTRLTAELDEILSGKEISQ